MKGEPKILFHWKEGQYPGMCHRERQSGGLTKGLYGCEGDLALINIK